MAQKTRRKTQLHTAEIIAGCTGRLAESLNCGDVAKKAASLYAARLYSEGSSGANAIDQGVKLAKRWKRLQVGTVRDNVIQFPRRA